MKRSFFQLVTIIPLVLLLCMTFSCQQRTEEGVELGLNEAEVNVIMADVVKVYNNADMQACDRVFSADYTEHDPLTGDIVGIDAFKESIRKLHEEYSSVNLSIDDTFIKGDRVAVLWTWNVTSTDGAEVGVAGVNIVRFVDGKLAESTYYYDTKKVLEEMGYKIVPPEESEKTEEPEKK
jgi:ketosteroid isomerase-like protein